MTHQAKAAQMKAAGKSLSDIAIALQADGASFDDACDIARGVGNYNRPSGTCRHCGGPASDGSDNCGEC